jgi:hypothetical protein
MHMFVGSGHNMNYQEAQNTSQEQREEMAKDYIEMLCTGGDRRITAQQTSSKILLSGNANSIYVDDAVYTIIRPFLRRMAELSEVI